MRFYNKVILIGNLKETPDTRYAPSGAQVTRLSLQIDGDEGARELRQPQVIDVIAFEKDGHRDGCSLSKGCWVLVEGRIQARSWKTVEGQRKKKLEIIAERLCPLFEEEPLRSDFRE